MAKANYMAKVRVSGICHWMAFASVLWQNPGRLQKVTSMGFVMEWLLPYNKHNGFSQLYIEMKHQKKLQKIVRFLKIYPAFPLTFYFDLQVKKMNRFQWGKSEILLDLKDISSYASKMNQYKRCPHFRNYLPLGKRNLQEILFSSEYGFSRHWKSVLGEKLGWKWKQQTNAAGGKISKKQVTKSFNNGNHLQPSVGILIILVILCNSTLL